MKRLAKRLIGLSIFVTTLAGYVTVYATDDTRFTQTEKPAVVSSAAASATTSQSITFKEGEYVRITQPSLVENAPTFDSQTNVMGEAREGTIIKIEVAVGSTEETAEKVLHDKTLGKYRLYELATVGATQTFNQLIDLGEGMNVIKISYTHEDKADVYGSMKFTIERKKQAIKEDLKNYNVMTSPNGISDKVSTK